MHVGSMESNVGTIAITVASSVEAERLKQNLINSNLANSSGSGSGSGSYDPQDDHNQKGNRSSSSNTQLSMRLSRDYSNNNAAHDMESGKTNSTAAGAAAVATGHVNLLTQRERKISQKLNPNLNPDHPYAQPTSMNNSNSNDYTAPSVVTATTASPPTAPKDRKKVHSNKLDSFEISDSSTERKSKSRK